MGTASRALHSTPQVCLHLFPSNFYLTWLPGSALSKYRGRDSDVDAICGAISALIAALELDTKRIIVIGHSMGCIIASELAAHMGLLGVVLLGPVQPSNSVTEVFVTRVKTVEDGTSILNTPTTMSMLIVQVAWRLLPTLCPRLRRGLNRRRPSEPLYVLSFWHSLLKDTYHYAKPLCMLSRLYTVKFTAHCSSLRDRMTRPHH